MAEVARDFFVMLALATLIVWIVRPRLPWTQWIILGLTLALPIVFALEYRGRSEESAGLFGIAIVGTSVMFVVYTIVLGRRLLGAPDRPTALAGLSFRGLSAWYLVSLMFWFAALYWSGSAMGADTLAFSVLDCPEGGVGNCIELHRQLTYPESLFVGLVTLITVVHSGITA